MTSGFLPRVTVLLHVFLTRCRIRNLAGSARNGDPSAIHLLADLFCSSENDSVQDNVAQAVCSIRRPDALDCFCNEIVLRNNPALTSFAVGLDLTPSHPSSQAIFFFVTGRKDRLSRLDPEHHHPLLAQAYFSAPAGIRERIRAAARDSGQSSLFARMIRGSPDLQEPAGWSPEEWDLIFDGLAREALHEEIWSLLFSAPPPVACKALRLLQTSGWKPPGDDCMVMEDLLTGLPGKWTFPVPANPDPVSFDTGIEQTVRLAFSPDGSLLASGDCTGTVCIWHTGRGSQITRPLKGPGSVRLLVFTPGNDRLLIYRDDGFIRCIAIGDATEQWCKSAGAGTGLCCASGEEIIVTGNSQGVLTITEIRTGLQHVIDEGNGVPVTSLLVLSAGNRKIAAGYEDGTICVRDTYDCFVLLKGNGSGDAVRELREIQGSLVVIRETLPPVWYNLLSGASGLINTAGNHPSGWFASAGSSGWFSLAGANHTLTTWRNPAHDPVAVIPFYHRGITCSAAVLCSSRLFCGCSEGTLRSLVMPEGCLLWEKKVHKRAVATIAVSPDGRMFASAGWDGTVCLLDPSTGRTNRTLQRTPGAIVGVAFSASGPGIVCGYEHGVASVYTLYDGTRIRSFDLYTPQVKAVSLSPDGRILASAGGDGALQFWDINDGSLIAGANGLSTSVRCMAFAPDTGSLVSGGWDGKLRLWSVPEGTLLATVTGHSSTVSCCAITPDGKYLVTGSNDTTAAVWSMPEFRRQVSISGSRSEISALAISPDGDLLAAGSADAVIRVFHVPSGCSAGTISALPGKVTSMVFTHAAAALVVGYETGTIAVFTFPAGHLIHSTGAHGSPVRGLVLNRSGSAVISAGSEGEIRYLPLPWIRPLSAVTPEEVSWIAAMAGSESQPTDTRQQWHFLHTLLAGRYRNEIGLCFPEEEGDPFDIQIVG